MAVIEHILFGLRILLILLVVGLGFVSFRAYYRNPSDRLATVFFGFAFISMAVAGSTVIGVFQDFTQIVRILGLIAYTVGFGMFYLALYR